MSPARVLLLGTAGAVPVPCPGCGCAQCEEARRVPALRRTRSGLWIEADGEAVLVDASADLLGQLEREGIVPGPRRVLLTHTHGDHVLGLDDLVRVRPSALERLEVGVSPFHRLRVGEMFPGLVGGVAPRILFTSWGAGAVLEVGGLRLEGFETGHRDTFPTTGVILEIERGGATRRLAVATDMGILPAASRERLRGFDVLVADGSWPGREGPGHPGSETVVALAAELSIARLVFTHVGHVGLEDRALRAAYGEGTVLAYDGDDLLGLLDA